MTERTGPTRYEIEIGGHATDRVLRPVIDEFDIELTAAGTTRMVGEVRDSSHLNGLLAHFTSMNVDLVGLRRLSACASDASSRCGTDAIEPLSPEQHMNIPERNDQ